MFKVPTAYERKQGEELCLQDDGDGFKWVLVKEGHVQKLDNPIPDWVSLGYSGIIGRNVSLTFFSRRLVLPH
ncbi:hypothetical protein HYU45_01550 [Candidatus Daviesbacteria bacterium]|nr:hypothetical protein [Candidatus Daviesbacteria bacterium]